MTIALDDETHRFARIRAAELGTPLSAMVKAYLQGIATGGSPVPAPEPGMREMSVPFVVAPSEGFVPLKKPRQPGALRGKIHMADDFHETPQWLIDAMEGKDSDKPWPQG
ncbi:hypothetical protein [Blastomonas sp. SL216]|uniref:hypothetical protein n=1 Tax=Blastomonas sp. SL216 TaxID=2995169 RepID=UPI0023774B65|nr:hypothetical protein OU999_05125 [Blastomonas sp. SL216]